MTLHPIPLTSQFDFAHFCSWIYVETQKIEASATMRSASSRVVAVRPNGPKWTQRSFHSDQ